MSAFSVTMSMHDACTDPEHLLETADNILWLRRHERPTLLVFTADNSKVARDMADSNVENDFAQPIASTIDPARGVDPTWAGTTVVIGRESFLKAAATYLNNLVEAGNYLLVVSRGEQDGRLPFVAFQAVKSGIEGVIIGRNMEYFGIPMTIDDGNACGGFPPAERSGGCGGF